MTTPDSIYREREITPAEQARADFCQRVLRERIELSLSAMANVGYTQAEIVEAGASYWNDERMLTELRHIDLELVEFWGRFE